MRQINIQVLTYTDQRNKPTNLTLNLIQTHLETVKPQHASLVVSQEKESTKKQKTLIPGKGEGRVLTLRKSSQPIDLLFPQGILTQSTTLIKDFSLALKKGILNRRNLENSFLLLTPNHGINLQLNRRERPFYNSQEKKPSLPTAPYPLHFLLGHLSQGSPGEAQGFSETSEDVGGAG